jgi:hypothetical protein
MNSKGRQFDRIEVGEGGVFQPRIASNRESHFMPAGEANVDETPLMPDLPPLNGTTSRERIWEWSKPREATNATRKEGTG